MPTNIGEWELLFCAGYIVPPCKDRESEIRREVRGSSIDVGTIPTEFFTKLFKKSPEQCPIEINFIREDGKQNNTVRNLIRVIAFENSQNKRQAAQELAYRLARVTDNRSPQGLFAILAGKSDNHTRILLCKFPADETLQARVTENGITIQLLHDSFSRKSSYFKAAMFEGIPAKKSFWIGRVEDRQAKYRAIEAAEFWIHDFLNSNPTLTDARGTLILSRALRNTIKKITDPDRKTTLVDSISTLNSQIGQTFSLSTFANSYLSQDTRSVFNKEIRGFEIDDIPFKLDRDTLNKELKWKSIMLDDTIIIKAPLELFERKIKITPTKKRHEVQVQIIGKITSKSLQKR